MFDLAELPLSKANEPEWKLLHRLADSLRPELQRELFAALDSLKEQIPTASLVDLIEQGQLDQVLAAVKLDLPDLEELKRVVREIAGRSAERARTVMGINDRIREVFPDAPGLRFDMVNRYSTDLLGDIDRWSDLYAGQLITEVNRETQQAVSEIVRRGFLEGQAPRVQALSIGQVVGLHSRDAGAVSRYLGGLVDSGVSELRAKELAATYRRRLIRKRAELIARTETMRASNMGQQLAWDAAADAGLLVREETRKRWIVTDDDRTCPRCLSLDDVLVEMDGQFREGADTAPSKGATTTLTPPLHPGCRCAMGLEFIEPETQPAPDATPEPEPTIVDVRGFDSDTQTYINERLQTEGPPNLRGVVHVNDIGSMPVQYQEAYAQHVRSAARQKQKLTGVTLYDSATHQQWMVVAGDGSVGSRSLRSTFNHELVHAQLNSRFPGGAAGNSTRLAAVNRAVEEARKTVGGKTTVLKPADIAQIATEKGVDRFWAGRIRDMADAAMTTAGRITGDRTTAFFSSVKVSPDWPLRGTITMQRLDGATIKLRMTPKTRQFKIDVIPGKPSMTTPNGRLASMFGSYSQTDAEEFVAQVLAAGDELDDHIRLTDSTIKRGVFETVIASVREAISAG